MTQSEMIWIVSGAVGVALVAGVTLYSVQYARHTRVRFGLVLRATLVAVFGISWAFCLPAVSRKGTQTRM